MFGLGGWYDGAVIRVPGRACLGLFCGFSWQIGQGAPSTSFGDLQLARLGVHVAHLLVLERRVELAVAERGLVADIQRAQGPDLLVAVVAGLADAQEVDLALDEEITG